MQLKLKICIMVIYNLRYESKGNGKGMIFKMTPENDCIYICQSNFIPWDKLKGKTILVTGGTGIIGGTLIDALFYTDQYRKLDITILVLVRDESKARERFDKYLTNNYNLQIINGTVEQLPVIDVHVDYIVHAASQTNSLLFTKNPVETILTGVLGTLNLLELARVNKSSGFVFLSSMEVYGNTHRGHKIKEIDECSLHPENVRCSYPSSKILSENLCIAYFKEYEVPASIIRLAQTFGPGVRQDDSRIFAEIGRCIRDKKDIVLHTNGKTERSYLYTADAVTAIFTVLLKGKPGEIYNAADERTYCSISEMAQKIAKNYGVRVQYNIDKNNKNSYRDQLYVDLSTDKLRMLGWSVKNRSDACVDHLTYMYKRMIQNSFSFQKKVLIVIPFPVYRAGVQIFILNLVKSLSPKDFLFTLYCQNIKDKEFAREFESNGVSIIPELPENICNASLRDKYLAIKNIYKICRNGQYDIIHINTSNLRFQAESLLIAKFAGIKYRISHGHFTPEKNGNNCKIRFLRYVIRHNASRLVSCSKPAAEYLVGEKHAKEVMVFTNCIDTEHFAFSEKTRTECRKRLELNENDLVYGNVASFSDYKNHNFLLEVFRLVVEENHYAKLLLVGDGILKKEIKNLVCSYGIDDHVIFAGPSNIVNEYLCAMDFFILPSLAEGLPFASLEAQAAGLPCLVSDAVPIEVAILENFAILSLKVGKKMWANKILSLNKANIEDRKVAWRKIKDAGRDIIEVKNFGEELYDSIKY